MTPVRITVPLPAQGASDSWWRTLTGIDPSKPAGYAVNGYFLDAGADYELPADTLTARRKASRATGSTTAT